MQNGRQIFEKSSTSMSMLSLFLNIRNSISLLPISTR